MADLHLALVYVARDLAGVPAQGELIGTQVMTLSGTSQESTLTVPASSDGAAKDGCVYWIVTPYGSTSCFASQGNPPAAASGTTGRCCPYLQSTPFKANPGEKLAVIWVS